MSIDVLKTRIKENNFSGVYLFCGSEEYTKDHYASILRKKVDSSPLPEFNHLYFNASTDKISDLEDAVYSLPYMWEYKLIEITDLESTHLTEADIEDYARVFSDIPEYLTILAVLRADEKTEEARTAKSKKSGLSAFSNTVAEHGLVVEFKTEKTDKLVNWIVKHFNAKGVKFELNVPREIINVCGSDMYILQSEIAKLYEVYEKTPLTVHDVRKYCCANSAYKYYDIAAALNRRDLVSAKRIFESLNLSRDELTFAVGALARNYSQILMVKTAVESGKGYDVVAKDTQMASWMVEKVAASARGVDSGLLRFAINQLSNADIKMKSYKGNPHRILEFTFFRICTYGRKA